MIVLAFANNNADQASVLAICDVRGFHAPKMYHEAEGMSVLRATADALAMVKDGQQVTLMCRLSDVQPPPGVETAQFADMEWQLAWLAHLETHGIGYVPVGDTEAKRDRNSGTSASSIRRYQRAVAALSAEVQALVAQGRAINRHVRGRPPYGYQAANGQLVIQPKQAKLVKAIFALLRDRKSLREVLAKMQDKSQEEYWDRVKLRRILSHAALYCRGEYKTARGGVTSLPALAILPAEWESVVPVSRGVGRVTMGTQPPSPTPQVGANHGTRR